MLLCRLFVSFLFSHCIWEQHMGEFLPSFLEFSRDTLRRFGSWGKSRELSLSENKWRHKPTIKKTRNPHHFIRRQPYNFICFKIANGWLIFRLAFSSATWRKVFRWLARHGIPTSERKVNSLVGSLFCRNVAWREIQFLSTRSQQDDMGGPGTIPKLVPSWFWCLWISVVNNVLFCCTCSMRKAESPKLTSIHLDEACAADAKVGLALPVCWVARCITIYQPARNHC